MRFDEVKAALCQAAAEAGVSEYEIYYMNDTSISCETLKDEISSFNSGVGGGVCFRCIYNGKMGYASSELFEADEMRELVKRAVSNAENMEGDDSAPTFFAGSEKYAEINNCIPEMPSTATLKDTALEIQRDTYSASEAVTDGTQSAVMASKCEIVLVNSHGLDLRNTIGMNGVIVQAVVNVDGTSEDEFEFSEGISRESYEGISERTVKKALAKIGACEVDSGKYDVVFSGKEMRSMLSAFADVFSGKEALNGMSLLDGKVGERIAAECITIVDDPMREGSSMQMNFDGEGVATYRKNVVESGVLKTLLYDIETAKKVGVSSTGNGKRSSYTSPVNIAPYCFYIKGGEKCFSELISGVEKGIYITELKGLHAGANAVTGDFSIESAGFLVENGTLTKAVKSFTVAGNFFDLLKNIEDISNVVDFSIPSSTSYGAPDVLVRQMSVAGK